MARRWNDGGAEGRSGTVDARAAVGANEAVRARGGAGSRTAEARAAGAYDRALGDYTRAALKANSSLALLNGIQALVMNLGLGVMAVMAGFEAAAGRMGPGDVRDIR